MCQSLQASRKISRSADRSAARNVTGYRFRGTPGPMFRTAIAFCLLTAVTIQNAATTTNSRIIGYVPEYPLDEIEPQHLAGVTDLVFFSIALPADGILPQQLLAAQHLAQVKKLRAKFSGKVLVTVGGWERSTGFAKLTTNKSARTDSFDVSPRSAATTISVESTTIGNIRKERRKSPNTRNSFVRRNLPS